MATTRHKVPMITQVVKLSVKQLSGEKTQKNYDKESLLNSSSIYTVIY